MSGDDIKDLVESNATNVRRMLEMTPLMCQWFDRELMVVHSQMPQNYGGLLMGCPVWGADYINRMSRYSLSTLGSPKNIKALRNRAWMVIYCEPAERPILWMKTRFLRQNGIHTIWRDLPEELLKLAKEIPEARYGLLAVVQNVLAHMAGHAGMGLHMYMVDHSYCDGYFEALADLGGKYPGIIQQGVSVSAQSAADDLEKFRTEDGFLAIPDRALGGIALKHMHPRSHMYMMNNGSIPDKLPDGRQVIWKGKNALHIADSAQLLAWVCPELCLDAPIAFTSTLDMLAPEYIPPGMWYMPKADDGLAFCELSDDSRIPPRSYVGLDRFNLRAWSQVAFTEDYMDYMARRAEVPIPEQEDGLSDDEIKRQHNWFMQSLREGKGRAMEAYFNAQHPTRW